VQQTETDVCAARPQFGQFDTTRSESLEKKITPFSQSTEQKNPIIDAFEKDLIQTSRSAK